jgi:MYXO-CTERM domain-containing protein
MRVLISCAAALLLLMPSTSMAKPAFLSAVPNTAALSCNTCHVPGQPKTVRNDFGIDVKANLNGGMPDWAAVCDIDSDGDGATNGEELQDVMCQWTGGANPGCSGLVTAPGDSNSTPANSFCGDGNCDAGEDDGCCAQDCMCGNGVCDDSEDADSCPDDCDEPAPPVDEDESDVATGDDVPEVDDVPVEDDTPVEEDATEPAEDVMEDMGAPEPDTAVEPGDAGTAEDAGAPPADAGTTPADAGTTPADAGAPADPVADDGGCSVAQQTPPVWLALLALFFLPFVIRRRED